MDVAISLVLDVSEQNDNSVDHHLESVDGCKSVCSAAGGLIVGTASFVSTAREDGNTDGK